MKNQRHARTTLLLDHFHASSRRPWLAGRSDQRHRFDLCVHVLSRHKTQNLLRPPGDTRQEHGSFLAVSNSDQNIDLCVIQRMNVLHADWENIENCRLRRPIDGEAYVCSDNPNTLWAAFFA